MSPEPSKISPSSPASRRRPRRPLPAAADRVERRAELYGAGAVAVISFFVYLLTLSPGLHFGDGPEFAAAAHVLGVPHPTGYPLYMILLKLWIVLTGGGDAIIRTTLFNAAISAASAGLSTLILLDLFRSALPRWADKLRLIAAISGALAAAFLRFHWSNAVVTEVYALQLLLTLGFLRSLQHFAAFPTSRSLVTAAAFLGLALAHHRMSLFLILPLLLVWAVAIRRRSLPSLRRPALLSALAVLLGLALYAYLPLRAAARPPLNWGDPSTPGRFISHVRGGEFVDQRFLRPVPTNPAVRFTADSYIAFAADELGQIVADFAGQILPLPEQFEENTLMQRVFTRPTLLSGLLLLPLAILLIAGARRLAGSSPLLLGVAALIAAQNVLLLFLYNILDIRDYYLFPFWLGWILAFSGLLVLIDRWALRPDAMGRPTASAELSPALVYALLLIPVLLAAANWQRSSRRDETGAERMSALVLPESKEVMPEGSLLLTAHDYDIYPAWYAQMVRGERPDVLVVGSNFLRHPWYRTQFTPEQVERYHLKFSGAIPHGPEGFVQQLAEGVIDANLPERPVFTTTLIGAPVLRVLNDRYRLTAVAETPLSGLGDYEPETTVALVRISPKESKP